MMTQTSPKFRPTYMYIYTHILETLRRSIYVHTYTYTHQKVQIYMHISYICIQSNQDDYQAWPTMLVGKKSCHLVRSHAPMMKTLLTKQPLFFILGIEACKPHSHIQKSENQPPYSLFSPKTHGTHTHILEAQSLKGNLRKI